MEVLMTIQETQRELQDQEEVVEEDLEELLFQEVLMVHQEQTD